MTPVRAALILGVPIANILKESEIRTAFIKACRATHPDTADKSVGRVKLELAELKVARDVLLKELNETQQQLDCPTCEGVGRQKTRRGGTIRCSTCAGDGVVRKKEVRRG